MPRSPASLPELVPALPIPWGMLGQVGRRGPREGERGTKLLPVVLSFGMGVESAAILHRWLTDAGSRAFELDQLIVVTAMTGDEFEDTGRLVELHLLPLMRAQGIRFVQLARAGRKASEGVVVLDDCRYPTLLHLSGRYTLGQEMLSSGTIPTSGGVRKCSIHAKGDVLDWFYQREFGSRPFVHVIGFNAGEPQRVKKDQSFSVAKGLDRRPSYPLVEWGWDRARAEEYLAAAVGEPWKKSCCSFCPFARGQEHILNRYREYPALAGYSLFIEHVALALNPRMTLYRRASLRDTLKADGNEAALDDLEQRLAVAGAWAVYRVRRVFTVVYKRGPTQIERRVHAQTKARSVQAVANGPRPAMESALRKLGGGFGRLIDAQDGHMRLIVSPRPSEGIGGIEEFYVVCVAVVADKENPAFGALEARMRRDGEQLDLSFAALAR